MEHKKFKISAIVSCYKGEKYLQGFLQNALEQTVHDTTEIVLVHNDPSKQELETVKRFQAEYPGLIKHIVVPQEPLAVSMNRCIKQATGEYVCIWNVDDLRTKDSLEKMAKTLDENPQVGFTYGDFIIVKKWLETKGKLITTPEFNRRKFIQSMYTGPFYMWRRALCQKIGYFDEQCLQGADFDYSSRLAVEYEGKKTHDLLGYYLNEGLGLSTNRASLQPIEATFIELRFGVYHKLDFWYYTKAKKYNIKQILTGGKWFNLDDLAPHWKDYAESPWWLVYAVFRYPFWFVKRVFKYILKHARKR